MGQSGYKDRVVLNAKQDQIGKHLDYAKRSVSRAMPKDSGRLTTCLMASRTRWRKQLPSSTEISS